MINTKTAVKILGLVMVVALTSGCLRIISFKSPKVVKPGQTKNIVMQVAAGKDLEGFQGVDLTVFILPPDGWFVGLPTYKGGYGKGEMQVSEAAYNWFYTDVNNDYESDNCGDGTNAWDEHWIGAPIDADDYYFRRWEAYSTPPVTLQANKFWKITIPVTAAVDTTGEGLFKIILAWSGEGAWICGASVITFIDTGVVAD